MPLELVRIRFSVLPLAAANHLIVVSLLPFDDQALTHAHEPSQGPTLRVFLICTEVLLQFSVESFICIRLSRGLLVAVNTRGGYFKT